MFPPEEDVDEDSVNNSRGLESSRGNLAEKRAEIAGRTRTDHATLAFLKRTTLRPLVEKIPPQLFFPACTAVTLVNARLDTGGKKIKDCSHSTARIDHTPISILDRRKGGCKCSVLNVLREGDCGFVRIRRRQGNILEVSTGRELKREKRVSAISNGRRGFFEATKIGGKKNICIAYGEKREKGRGIGRRLDRGSRRSSRKGARKRGEKGWLTVSRR